MRRRSFISTTTGALTGIALLPEATVGRTGRLAAPQRIGLIGTGRQGRAIIAELQKIPDVTIAAVCDSSPARLRTALERAPGAEGLADYRVLLGRGDITAVIVATRLSSV